MHWLTYFNTSMKCEFIVLGLILLLFREGANKSLIWDHDVHPERRARA